MKYREALRADYPLADWNLTHEDCRRFRAELRLAISNAGSTRLKPLKKGKTK